MLRKRMSFAYLLLSDIKQGIISRIWWYMAAMPIVIYLILMFSNELNGMMSDSVTRITVTDIFTYVYEGVKIFERKEDMTFPVMFVSYIMVPFIITSYYPFNDFEERGKVIFTRTRKRSLWWYSKCLWNVVSIVTYQLIMLITAIGYCVMGGKVSFEPSEKAAVHLGIVTMDCKLSDIFIYVFIIPTLTIIALSFLQMTISVIMSPVYGMMVQVVMLVLSIFVYSPLLPHNFLMLRRSAMVIDNGYKLPVVITVCVIISVISVIVGRNVIEKKDIL